LGEKGRVGVVIGGATDRGQIAANIAKLPSL
jgi:hypothetical protein